MLGSCSFHYFLCFLILQSFDWLAGLHLDLLQVILSIAFFIVSSCFKYFSRSFPQLLS
jgi:hypothetical protein